jgi:hypothetical protein
LPELEIPQIEFIESTHRYKVNGEFFPSVTTIIDAVVPKNLAWWGMAVGVRGTMEVLAKWEPEWQETGVLITDERIISKIREERLSVYHIRDEKGEEGTAVHKALERYAKTGEVPNLTEYSPAVRPKVRALANFLLDYRPRILESECRVASLIYRYAGTFDLRAELQAHKGVGIIDLKTGKRIYADSQFPQLAAYEQASVECGAEPTAFQAILHLTPDGEYDFQISTDTFDDFRVLLDHYTSVKRREQRLKDSNNG